MNKFYFMCGLPGSGKSTYAEKLKEEGVIIHSSDKIREELGDVNDQSKNIEVFEILHKRIKNDLQNGKNVAYDATNLNRRRRRAFLQEIQNVPCKKICVLVATPYEMCLAQNIKRDRKVPEEVIWRMYTNFQMPCVQEGFDEVIIHYPKEEWKEYYGNIGDFIISLLDFNQENSHHSLTLGKHMMKVGDYVFTRNSGRYNDLYYAAVLHDNGKPNTKSFFNSKGEMDTEAHYFSHHNVGAYNSLFFEYPRCPENINKEYVALLIESHMKPFMEWKQNENAKEKDRKLFGNQVIEDIMLLHEADLASK